MSETISQLAPATKANLTDLYPGSQGSNGPGTGTTRGVTLAQILAPTSADGVNSVTILPFQEAAAFVGNTAQVLAQYTTNASGGSGVVSNGRFYTSIAGAPNAFLWSLLGVLDYDGTGGTGQHVAVYGQGLRRTYTAGGTAANPQIWAGVFESRDLSNQPSSATNAQLGIEIDILANGLDDANMRQGISMVIGKAQTGATAEVATGIGIYSGDGVSSVKKGISIATPFTAAGLDFRSATQTSGNAIWLGDNHTIGWNTTGNAITRWDPTINSANGGVRFSSFVQIDSTLFVPNGSTFGGLITAAGGGSVTGAAWSVSVPGTSGNQVTNFSQFAPLVNPAGYIHLPGGVTLQWGNGTGPTSTITMPYTFAAAPWSINCTLKDAAAGGAAIFVQTQTGTVTASAFTALTVTGPGAGVAANFWWFAVGQT